MRFSTGNFWWLYPIWKMSKTASNLPLNGYFSKILKMKVKTKWCHTVICTLNWSYLSWDFIRKSAPRYSGYKSSSTRKWTAWELSFRKSLVGYRKLFFKLTKNFWFLECQNHLLSIWSKISLYHSNRSLKMISTFLSWKSPEGEFYIFALAEVFNNAIFFNWVLCCHVMEFVLIRKNGPSWIRIQRRTFFI